MKIAILTDSSSGIKDIENYPNLFIVPLMITKENEEQIFDDCSLSADDFYKMNSSQKLKTSQTIPGVMLDKWNELLKDYDQIICLLLSKGLSGQYNTFKMFSQEDDFKNKVFVVDTNSVSILLKRQIQLVEKMIEDGKTGEEIQKLVENYYNKFEGYIIPKSLNHLVRGGRISRAAANLAKILKIVPILKFNGEIDKQEKTRTFKKAIEKSFQLIKENYPANNMVDISYSRSDLNVINLVKNVAYDQGVEIGLFDELPNVITCHTGDETFAIMPHKMWEVEKWK